MPRLDLFGRYWYLGSDDFSVFGWPSILLHLTWFFLTFSGSMYHYLESNYHVRVFYSINAILCFLATVLDICIVLFAMRGSVLEPEKRLIVSKLLRLRIPIGLLIFGVASVSVLVSVRDQYYSDPEWYARKGILYTEIIVYTLAFLFARLISRDPNGSTHLVSITRWILRFYGAAEERIISLLMQIDQIEGDVDLVPTDLLAGLYLLAAENYENLPRGQGVDINVLEDMQRLAPFAMGIYGCPLSFWATVTKRGTSLISLRRFFKEVFPCLPCWVLSSVRARLQGHWCCCSRQHNPAEGDWCGFSDTFALQRMVAEVGEEIEILWANWTEESFNSMLPMAVLLDHSKRDFVITIRGTASLQDVVTDAHVMMDAYHPPCFGAGTDTSAFKVHKGMLECMRNIMPRLEQSGVLRKLEEGGRAHGYRIVCTGHSLGAGVASLVALELRGKFGEQVQYIGFECPRACMSPELAEETRGFGWYASALHHDWAPRMSARNLQHLREDIIDKLRACPLSKFQINLKFSHQCLSTFFRNVVGSSRKMDPIEIPTATTSMLSMCSARELSRTLPGFYAEDTCGPGNIVIFRSNENEKEPLCCGFYSRDVQWQAEWARSDDDFRKLSIHPKAIEYHFPHIVLHAISDASAAKFESCRSIIVASD